MRRIIDASQCVQRVRQLLHTGHTTHSIAALAGLTAPIVEHLATGPAVVSYVTHNKIMRLGLPSPAEAAAEDLPCTVDPDRWFSSDPHQRASAMRICRGCPKQVECAELGETESWGIWGGLPGVHPNQTRPDAKGRRRHDLAELLDCGVTFEAAAARLGMTASALQRWCYRNAPELLPQARRVAA